MIPTRAYAAFSADKPLAPFQFERRDPRPQDVVIDLAFCGICHSDIHTVRDEWGHANFPVVPGHEMAGKVSRVGAAVKKFKVGDAVGVGCFVDSCRQCENCKAGEEQFCDKNSSFTYNGVEQDGKTPTQGGYSSQIVVDENYVLKIPSNLPLDRAAPLMCAGITTYSPLKAGKVGKGSKVGIVGLGGLGHMGVKFAVSMGADVTVLSTSPSKEADAKKLGAQHFALTKAKDALTSLAGQFDFILDTVAAKHDIDAYLGLLKRGGTLALVGASPEPLSFQTFSLIMRARHLRGSLIGGMRETQEMLDYCGKNNVLPDIELIPAAKINEAYDRTVKSDVRYRFVIDLKTL